MLSNQRFRDMSGKAIARTRRCFAACLTQGGSSRGNASEPKVDVV
jgi:hypothetical protein